MARALSRKLNIEILGRFNKKVDKNQSEIVQALREVGASVYDASTVGQGFPDLVVGFNGVNYLIEVKRVVGNKTTKLNDKQQHWHDNWNGNSSTVSTPEEAVQLLDAELIKHPQN